MYESARSTLVICTNKYQSKTRLSSEHQIHCCCNKLKPFTLRLDHLLASHLIALTNSTHAQRAHNCDVTTTHHQVYPMQQQLHLNFLFPTTTTQYGANTWPYRHPQHHHHSTAKAFDWPTSDTDREEECQLVNIRLQIQLALMLTRLQDQGILRQ
jgi:hypothetical protein